MFKIFGRKFFHGRSFFSLLKLFSKKEGRFSERSKFWLENFWTHDRLPSLEHVPRKGGIGIYTKDYPSPRTAPIRNSKVGHYKFKVWEVVWIFRPGLPINPTKM